MIKLDDNYTIDSDAYNWILRCEKTYMGKDKQGNPKEQTSINETFHASFKQCILEYINETAKECKDLISIIELLNHIEVKLDNFKIKK